MALIPFKTLLECLQSSYIILILTGQEGLYYGDICFMPQHHMLYMQCIPFSYFTNMVDYSMFHLPKYKTKDSSGSTATDEDWTSIEYVHIGLIIC